MNKDKLVTRRMKEAADHFRKDHINRAMDLYESVLKVEPEHEEASLMRFQCMIRIGPLSRLKSEADSLVQRFPDSAQAWMSRGQAYYQNHEISDAEESYRRCIALDASNFQAILDLGIILVTYGDCAEGISLLEKAVTMNPDSQTGYSILTRAYHMNGRYEDAIKAGEQAPDALQQAPDLHCAYGDALYQTGNFHQARSVFSQIVEKTLLSSDMNAMLCPIVKESEGYDHKRENSDADPDQIAATYYRAFLKFEHGTDESPISSSDLLQVLSMNQSHGYAYSGLASGKNLSNKQDEALIFIDQAIEAEPDNIIFKRQKGFLLVNQDPARAGVIFNELLERDPDDAKSGLGKAWALKAAGQSEESTALLNELTTRDPSLLLRLMGMPTGESGMASRNR